MKIEPFEDLGFAKIDHHRQIRQGIRRGCILVQAKHQNKIVEITNSLLNNGQETSFDYKNEQRGKRVRTGENAF